MTGQELQLSGDDERHLARLMARARIFADIPGLKRELAGNAQAVAGVMLTLEGFNLPVTLPSINDSFDWIEGRAAPTSHFYQAVARRSGYEIRPVERTSRRAVARISARGVEPIDVEFTAEMAADAHRFDEWVERWNKTETGKSYANRYVVRVDGEKVNEPWPEWAAAMVEAGNVKRFDAWWNYRADMLWKSAAKRAVKIACPHLLLGDVADHEISAPAGEPRKGPPAGVEPDEDIIDAELVDEPDEPAAPADPDDDDGRPF